MENKKRITSAITEKFNILSTVINGTYWKIQQQRDNAVEYEMYSILEREASLKGNEELATRYQQARERNCYFPIVEDPTYVGSWRERQDKNDAQYKAKNLAQGVEQEITRRENNLSALPLGLK